MAFYDWDGNGKTDWRDDYIEYQSFSEYENEKNTQEPEPSGWGPLLGCMEKFVYVLTIFGVLAFLGSLLKEEWKCLVPECNEVVDAEFYYVCEEHRDEYTYKESSFYKHFE